MCTCVAACVGLELLKEGNELNKRSLHDQALARYRHILELGAQLTNCSSHSESLVEAWVPVLHQTGLQLNRMQAHEPAFNAFSLALRLCLLMGDCPGVSLTAKVLAAIVGMHIHLGDCTSAGRALNQHIDLLFWREEGREALVGILLELGLAQLEATLCSSAGETLRKACQLVEHIPGWSDPRTLAQIKSALGYCCLVGQDDSARGHLDEALQHWRCQPWLPQDALTVMNTLKHHIEVRFRAQEFGTEQEEIDDLLMLHRHRAMLGLGMQVADTFTYLATVAFHKESETTAIALFQQALTLYKQVPSNEANKEEIVKLLRFLGVACYNGRNFERASQAYHECLQLLEAYQAAGNLSNLGQIADCCASLGFTYSRLRNFDNMLLYYERALELEGCLAYEDLQLIETNIGSLYHVSAVKYEQQGIADQAKKYYQRAEDAFSRALRYSWKSFPYINYGYYLLCRGQYEEASDTLQQGYLNGVIDKDTVEFDHTEDPILLDDLRHELIGCQDIRLPAAVIALYLKGLALLSSGNRVVAEQTARQLSHEVNSTRFSSYYVEGYGESRMNALCLSLVGYAYRSLHWQHQALQAFQAALAIHGDYPAAYENVRIQGRLLNKQNTPEKSKT